MQLAESWLQPEGKPLKTAATVGVEVCINALLEE